MKLIYMEPVLEEIEKQQEYFEQAEDFDCAEAVMSAKWAVIDAKEVEAIPIEWLVQWRDKLRTMGEYQQECADCICYVLRLWKKEQEA